MIRKSGNRFSEKIMLQQLAKQNADSAINSFRFNARCSLCSGATYVFNRQRWTSRPLGDFPILLDDKATRGFVLFQAAEELGRHAPIGAL